MLGEIAQLVHTLFGIKSLLKYNFMIWFFDNHQTQILLQNKQSYRDGILLPKLFKPNVRKNCSSDQEKLLIFEAAPRYVLEFANFLRSLEQFIQTVKGQNNFW
jgi:hypothetical protein